MGAKASSRKSWKKQRAKVKLEVLFSNAMMITIDHDDRRFHYRVVGVAVHNDAVLLHQGEGDDFWTLPGGRAEIGEPAAQTLKREMQEELGVLVEVTFALVC